MRLAPSSSGSNEPNGGLRPARRLNLLTGVRRPVRPAFQCAGRRIGVLSALPSLGGRRRSIWMDAGTRRMHASLRLPWKASAWATLAGICLGFHYAVWFTSLRAHLRRLVHNARHPSTHLCRRTLLRGLAGTAQPGSFDGLGVRTGRIVPHRGRRRPHLTHISLRRSSRSRRRFSRSACT